jgi:hypothetical protein
VGQFDFEVIFAESRVRFPLLTNRPSIFSATALRDAAKLRRILRASGQNPFISTTIPLALRRPRFCGAVSKRRLRVYRQSPKEGEKIEAAPYANFPAQSKMLNPLALSRFQSFFTEL